MAIFGLSVFALFTTVYKTAAALPKLKHAQADFSWLVAQVVLWGIVESNVVIIAGSIPTWGWVLQSKGFEKFITLISHNSLWTSRRPERLPSHNGDVDNVSDKVGLRPSKESSQEGQKGAVALESIDRIERSAFSYAV